MPSASAGGVFLGEIMEYAKRIRRELAPAEPLNLGGPLNFLRESVLVVVVLCLELCEPLPSEN